jgi:hypothetical protein
MSMTEFTAGRNRGLELPDGLVRDIGQCRHVPLRKLHDAVRAASLGQAPLAAAGLSLHINSDNTLVTREAKTQRSTLLLSPTAAMNLIERWADAFVLNFPGQKTNMDKYLRCLRDLAFTHTDDTTQAERVRTWTAFAAYDDYTRQQICLWHQAASCAPPGTMRMLNFWELQLGTAAGMFGAPPCPLCGRPHLAKNCSVIDTPAPVVRMLGAATAPGAPAGSSTTGATCHRYNSAAGCRMPGCKYAHLCSVAGCGAAHSASAAHTAAAAPAVATAVAAAAAV